MGFTPAPHSYLGITADIYVHTALHENYNVIIDAWTSQHERPELVGSTLSL